MFFTFKISFNIKRQTVSQIRVQYYLMQNCQTQLIFTLTFIFNTFNLFSKMIELTFFGNFFFSCKMFQPILNCVCTLTKVRNTFTPPGVNFINMLTCCFYMHRSQKRKKAVKSSVDKKWTNLLCCCTSADLHFTLCAQV